MFMKNVYLSNKWNMICCKSMCVSEILESCSPGMWLPGIQVSNIPALVTTFL